MRASRLFSRRRAEAQVLFCSMLWVLVVLAWLFQVAATHAQAVDLGLQNTGKTTTKWIGRAGGQLKLPLASGGSAVLAIPKSALLGSTLITMSEVKLASPMKGLNHVRGIKLEPDGLEFVLPYSLQVTLPAYGNAKLPIAVGYSGAGQQAHLYPSAQTANTLTVQADHFSGFIFSDAEAEAARVFEQAATDLVRARIAQMTAARLSAERQCQLLGGDCNSIKLGDDLFCRMQEEFIKPLIEKSKQPNLSCAESASIASILLGFERQVQLLGASGPTSSSFYETVSSTTKRCKVEALKICRQTGDPMAMMQQILSSERQNQLTGTEPDEDLDFGEAMKQCGTYSVKVTTRQKTIIDDITNPAIKSHLNYAIDFETPWTDGESKSLSSSMQFDLSGEVQGEPAEASLWITEYSNEMKGEKFLYNADTLAQPLEKAKIKLSFLARALREPMRTAYSIEKKTFETDAVVHIVDPGKVQENFNLCGPDVPCLPFQWLDWDKQFRLGHRKLLRGDVVTFPVPIRGLAPDIASRTFAGPLETGTIENVPHYVQESTDVTVRFRPATGDIDAPVSQPPRRKPLRPGVASKLELRKVQCPG